MTWGDLCCWLLAIGSSPESPDVATHARCPSPAWLTANSQQPTAFLLLRLLDHLVHQPVRLRLVRGEIFVPLRVPPHDLLRLPGVPHQDQDEFLLGLDDLLGLDLDVLRLP